MCLAEGMLKTLPVAGASSGGTAGFDISTKMHHDAIFASKEVAQSEPSVSAAKSAGPSTQKVVGRVGSAGVMGAAARARLALTGKLGKTQEVKSSRKGVKSVTTASKEQPVTPSEDQPLFKTLKVRYACGCLMDVAEGHVYVCSG